MNYSTSKQLISNCKGFLEIKYFNMLSKIDENTKFYGWGRKKSGLNAMALSKKHHSALVLLEDGFIRSLGLGLEGSPTFSIVEDDVGIYYDATGPSKLENILNTYHFHEDTQLMNDAKNAIAQVKTRCISKYNNSTLDLPKELLSDGCCKENRVLVIAQTSGDASLEYGMLDDFRTDEMIQLALDENPSSKVYLKIHPDVLSGKKKSDIDIASVSKACYIIEENVNPIVLLKYFKKVYTKTSGMGFEALLLGCECVCFGMPFYAGWGVTIDKSVCARRKVKRSVEEIFAAAYILYTHYYNPYKRKESDIFDTIACIEKKRKLEINDTSLSYKGI